MAKVSFEEYENFPKTQQEPDITLLGGHDNVKRLNGQRTQPTSFWKIMNPFGPLSMNPSLVKPYEIDSDREVVLAEQIRIREEKFGGILYNGGIVAAVNKPGYAILEKLKSSPVKAGEIPEKFLKELAKYRALDFA